MEGKLFSQDFLLEGIRSTPAWEALTNELIDTFLRDLKRIYSHITTTSQLNEANTEADIIEKVLGLLDWHDLTLRQVSASATRRENVPDFLLFPDVAAKQAARAEKRDDRRYRHGIAILEAKRWMRPLDRGEATDRLDPGTPSNQILRYLSSVEVQPKANLEKRDGVTNAENSTLSDEDRGAFGAWLMLAFIIALVLIGYKIVSFLRPKPNPNKAPAVGTKWLSLIWAGLATAPSNSQGHDENGNGNGNGGDSKVSEDKVHHTAPPLASRTGGVIYITPYNGFQHDGYELSGLFMKPYDGSNSGRFESSAQMPIPAWAVVLGLVAKK